MSDLCWNCVGFVSECVGGKICQRCVGFVLDLYRICQISAGLLSDVSNVGGICIGFVSGLRESALTNGCRICVAV